MGTKVFLCLCSKRPLVSSGYACVHEVGKNGMDAAEEGMCVLKPSCAAVELRGGQKVECLVYHLTYFERRFVGF